jgi:hypothetical protein
MKDPASDGDVERPRVIQILERDATIKPPFGSVRVDRENVIAGCGQRRRNAAFGSATDLEDTRRGRRQLYEYVVEEVESPCRITACAPHDVTVRARKVRD